MDLSEEFNKHTYLAHLILGSDTSNLSEVTKAEGYDLCNSEVSVTINGVVVRTEKLETLLGDWSERLLKQKMEEVTEYVELMKLADGFKCAVTKAVKEKLQEAIDNLDWRDLL